MTTEKDPKQLEKTKAQVRIVLLLSALIFFVLSGILAAFPKESAEILATDADIIMVLKLVFAGVAVADIIIAQTVFKPKDRV